MIVGFEVLTAVVMKGTTFRHITPCSSSKSTGVSEERFVSIFRVVEYAEQKTGMKELARRATSCLKF
jgi:hypothetical protein